MEEGGVSQPVLLRLRPPSIQPSAFINQSYSDLFMFLNGIYRHPGRTKSMSSENTQSDKRIYSFNPSLIISNCNSLRIPASVFGNKNSYSLYNPCIDSILHPRFNSNERFDKPFENHSSPTKPKIRSISYCDCNTEGYSDKMYRRVNSTCNNYAREFSPIQSVSSNSSDDDLGSTLDDSQSAHNNLAFSSEKNEPFNLNDRDVFSVTRMNRENFLNCSRKNPISNSYNQLKDLEEPISTNHVTETKVIKPLLNCMHSFTSIFAKTLATRNLEPPGFVSEMASVISSHACNSVWGSNEAYASYHNVGNTNSTSDTSSLMVSNVNGRDSGLGDVYVSTNTNCDVASLEFDDYGRNDVIDFDDEEIYLSSVVSAEQHKAQYTLNGSVYDRMEELSSKCCGLDNLIFTGRNVPNCRQNIVDKKLSNKGKSVCKKLGII